MSQQKTEEVNAEQVMLRIEWIDRRAAEDACTCSLADFLEANTPEGLGDEHRAAVSALKPGESVRLDWTTVTRIADEPESRRLDFDTDPRRCAAVDDSGPGSDLGLAGVSP